MRRAQTSNNSLRPLHYHYHYHFFIFIFIFIFIPRLTLIRLGLVYNVYAIIIIYVCLLSSISSKQLLGKQYLRRCAKAPWRRESQSQSCVCFC